MPYAPRTAFVPNPDGIDDWITPGARNDPYPDDWFVPPPATLGATQPGQAGNPPPNPNISNRSAPRPDPLAAYWATIPASRLTEVAWDPPPALGDVSSTRNLPPGMGRGPYAHEQIQAGPGKRPNIKQQEQINASGNDFGCHNCGAKDPGTGSGNWIGNHQTHTALGSPEDIQFFLPHCASCSARQGGLVRSFKRRGR
jgi:hypothetical protein